MKQYVLLAALAIVGAFIVAQVAKASIDRAFDRSYAALELRHGW